MRNVSRANSDNAILRNVSRAMRRAMRNIDATTRACGFAIVAILEMRPRMLRGNAGLFGGNVGVIGVMLLRP